MAKWTKEEIIKLKELYPTTYAKDLIKVFKRTANTIRSQAYYLGIESWRTKPWTSLVGKRVGKLLITGIARREKSTTKEGIKLTRIVYAAKCDCGNTTEAYASNLTRDHTKSCGCLWKAVISKKVRESSFNQFYNLYRTGARRRRLSFRLSKKLFRILTQQNCHYCGIEPKHEYGCSPNGKYAANGIDRVDNDCGYSIKNCVPCCKICNWAKRTLTYDEFIAYLNQITIFRANNDKTLNKKLCH